MDDGKVSQGQRFYRPELDILRFFAFLCIFAIHIVNPKDAGGDVGAAAEHCLAFAVSLFFLLSAFLLTTLLDMELERTGKTRVGAFYVRRLTRIWPVYYFFLALSMVIGHFASVWSVTTPLLRGS